MIHADVNAALNIAAASHCYSKTETERIKNLRKKMRRQVRQEQAGAVLLPVPVMVPSTPAELFGLDLPAAWSRSRTSSTVV